MSQRYRYKGRFIKKKVRDALLMRSEKVKNLNATKRIQKMIENEEVRSCNIEGARIIDVKHMSKQMVCTACKTPLLMQDIEQETKRGVASIFYVRCSNCLLLVPVKSDQEYDCPVSNKKMFVTNTKTALVSIHTGIGNDQANKFLNILGIRGMDSKVFKSHERIIGPVIEYVAKESCSEVAEMERLLTLENIEELKKLL